MPRQRPQNPIHAAIETWVESLRSKGQYDEDENAAANLVASAPKRFTTYEPMVVLPAGSFRQPAWTGILQSCTVELRNSLWSLIVERISKATGPVLTHLAVTGGIPLRREGEEAENVLRSPSGLRMLYGDFGPADIEGNEPLDRDFAEAFWVSTRQNGIIQKWAPRWTMFSRGNIKEKARVLAFPRPRGVDKQWAVDLYAGIGYFVFSYARLGMKVLCWEINPWSVEGLRRGAIANKWKVKVLKGEELSTPLEEVMAGGEQIVVFQEDNQLALERIRTLQSSLGMAKEISHVNGGLLPTSEPTWKLSWDLADQSSETWLHLHENVGVQDMESRREELQGRLQQWAELEGNARTPRVEHIEQVKTFAPDVWHCVFDVHITRDNSNNT